MRFAKHLAMLLLSLLALAQLSGCQSAPVTALNTDKNGKPALWLVSDPASGAQAYLFGSIHALPSGLNWKTPLLEKAIQGSAYLLTEIGHDPTNDDARFLKAIAQDEAVPSFAQRVDPKLLPAAIALAESLGFDEARRNRTESWAISLFLVPNVAAQFSLEKEFGVESVLAKNFPGEAWGRQGLELPRDQYLRFDNLSENDQNTLLRMSLEKKGGAYLVEGQINAWMSGDLIRLEQLNRDGIASSPSLHNALLVEPNRIWAANIAQQMRQGRQPFITVGAAHLIGPGNLRQQLEAQGFIVTRIQ